MPHTLPRSILRQPFCNKYCLGEKPQIFPQTSQKNLEIATSPNSLERQRVVLLLYLLECKFYEFKGKVTIHKSDEDQVVSTRPFLFPRRDFIFLLSKTEGKAASIYLGEVHKMSCQNTNTTIFLFLEVTTNQ